MEKLAAILLDGAGRDKMAVVMPAMMRDLWMEAAAATKRQGR